MPPFAAAVLPTPDPSVLAYGASYEKMAVSLRYWLLGRRFFQALDAMELGASLHTGTRKDGTPEFSHQIWQAQYLRTLESGLLHPEDSFITVFLHDAVEDKMVVPDSLTARFGPRSGTAIESMSKVVLGQHKTTEAYFDALARDPIASVAKGIDRIHNHGSMLGAFTKAKIGSYLQETDDHILPMLKRARRAFPQQEPVYENIRMHLMAQRFYLHALLAVPGLE